MNKIENAFRNVLERSADPTGPRKSFSPRRLGVANIGLVRRIQPLYANKHYGPDHHIWNNNGSWWAHFSITRLRGRAKRMRISLHTKNRKVARERRDQLMKSKPDRIKALQKKWRASRNS